MLEITSRDNRRLKNARKVRDGRINDAIFIEGVRLAAEALQSDLELSEIFFSESFLANEGFAQLQKTINPEKTHIFRVSDDLLSSISDTKTSQGVVIIAKLPPGNKKSIESKLKTNFQTRSLVVMLHEINNPSNLGAVLRTAEAAGVGGIITTKSSANAFSPKALRSAMGASFRLPLWRNADFDEAIDWAKEQNLTTLCADIHSTKNYVDVDWNKNYLLVFGSEAHGLSESERNKIDESIYIPMENNVESLNLAVACGIIMFEAKKSVRKK